MQIDAHNLSGGIFASSMIPFAQNGDLLFDELAGRVEMIGSITGILGIAINTTARERLCMTYDERLEVIRRTRQALGQDQLLLCCVDELSDAMIEDVRHCQKAGADAIIACPTSNDQSADNASLQQFSDLAKKMPLPVIVTLGHGDERWSTACDEITALAASSDKIVGFDMGSGDNVLQYDQDYYAVDFC
jgi:dihydrodipicolinate synthase/N-acetylneuraminate lyase